MTYKFAFLAELNLIEQKSSIRNKYSLQTTKANKGRMAGKGRCEKRSAVTRCSQE